MSCVHQAAKEPFGHAGITQRTVRAPASGGAASAKGSNSAFGHGAYPCFHAMPESQPVLPCLLRRLLQKGKTDAALALAVRHSRCGTATLHHLDSFISILCIVRSV